ncbi:glycoside hydrolase family 18 protein [Lachnoclostridium phytofermentans]|uniref:chitinase n=1 Tax=Lachnoclostridium phytofermentans (strain ATCC 700394 / DSM 18823 / ISDg) TaxID=357809 RepID=A9KMH9_LACP7|nr:glycoside hydrolase family 18 protein [Lachnoclostridium phytofermentans]ABX42933.1 glycoside hydrolase family 18 [Lachnoclostridium phytofermentans ISDg]
MFRENAKIVKVAYLPIFKIWHAGDVPGDLLTDVNLAFGEIAPDSTIQVNPIKELDLPKELEILKQNYPNLRINLAIGGWGADGFSDMAFTKETRSVFINSIVSYLEAYDLDGVDIDWEYPTRDHSGLIKARPEDTENFILLMKEIRSKFNELSKTSDKKYTLSFAAPAGDWAVETFGIKEVSNTVDYINLMAYDYVGPWSRVTGHHSNLMECKEAPNHISTYQVIQNYLKVCNPEKLVLGIPAYGYGWRGVASENHGLFQAAEAAISHEESDFTYNNLKENYISKNGYTRYWDDISKAACLHNGDILITYEDLEAIRYKVDTVKKLRLGGMMYWEQTQDLTGDIIKTISEGLENQ